MKDTIALVLAAGKGTRMKSRIPKVLHEILGRPMIAHLLDSVLRAGVDETIVVAGYGSGLFKEKVRGVRVVLQKTLLGSGDAVMSARKELKDHPGDILVLYGDTPLITGETIRAVIAKHKASRASATILTAFLKDPRGYGRIVRTDDGKVAKIVEELEAGLYEEVIEEINAGLYCFRGPDLFGALNEIRPENKKKEYYLTDVIAVLRNNKKTVESIQTKDTDEILGVNTREALAEAAGLLKKRILKSFMSNGVTIQDPSSTTIYPGVRIGKETVVYPNTIIESGVEIGDNCRIGPFARLRSGVRLGDGVEIGNFVELVRTTVDAGTRIKHHTYLGDAILGKGVNVGAGTITANYDGKTKHKTVIEDDASLGVGTILIAPVRVGRRAITGAGSVVPRDHDVPPGALVAGVPARVMKNFNMKVKRRGAG